MQVITSGPRCGHLLFILIISKKVPGSQGDISFHIFFDFPKIFQVSSIWILNPWRLFCSIINFFRLLVDSNLPPTAYWFLFYATLPTEYLHYIHLFGVVIYCSLGCHAFVNNFLYFNILQVACLLGGFCLHSTSLRSYVQFLASPLLFTARLRRNYFRKVL